MKKKQNHPYDINLITRYANRDGGYGDLVRYPDTDARRAYIDPCEVELDSPPDKLFLGMALLDAVAKPCEFEIFTTTELEGVGRVTVCSDGRFVMYQLTEEYDPMGVPAFHRLQQREEV